MVFALQNLYIQYLKLTDDFHSRGDVFVFSLSVLYILNFSY